MVRTNLSVLCLPCLLLATACSTIDDRAAGGSKTDDPGATTCDDPAYGDGVCQTSLACAAPDIDCFVTFEDDTEAAAWFSELEAQVAAIELTAPRSIIAPSDPRHVRARQLLDRGWEVYRATRPVGELEGFRPALVVVEDPTINAFAGPSDLSRTRSAFAVIAHTGLLEVDASEDALLGMMMHEFEHAVGLHMIGDVKMQLRRFYVAPEGTEPLGAFELDDPEARMAGETWRALGEEVGYFSDAALGGLPVSDSTLGQTFSLAIGSWIHAHLDICTAPAVTLDQLNASIGRVSGLDGSLTVDAAQLPAQVDAALAELRDVCMADFTKSFTEVVALIRGLSEDEIKAQMSDRDLLLVRDRHFVDAVVALVADRRAQMRGIERDFATTYGSPWSSLRYYSYEQAADDVSVSILADAGRDPAGLAELLLLALDPETLAQCDDLLAAGATPPYGKDLVDEHHAPCWRVANMDAMARYLESGSAATVPTARRMERGEPDYRRLPLEPVASRGIID